MIILSMEKYKIYHSQRFDKELSKLNKDFLKRIDKIENELVKNPFSGKPLGVSWLREKRYEKYRIYYLIYDNFKTVFMVAISEKKNQQKIINTIRLLLNFFREEIENLVRVDFDGDSYLIEEKYSIRTGYFWSRSDIDLLNIKYNYKLN